MDDTDQKQEKISRYLKSSYRKRHGGLAALTTPLVISAGFWAIYLLKLVNIDVIEFLHPTDRRYNNHPMDKTPVLLAVAIIGTIVAFAIALKQRNRARTLIKGGVETTARVVAKSPLEKHGSTPTTFAYSVDGKEYKFRRDMPDDLYEIGDEVRILYDPTNPRTRDII